MSQIPNQFSQTVTKGMQDLRFNPNTIPCAVKSDEATALVPGQLVKLVDSAGGVPKVTAITADTDAVFGAVAYNGKDQSFAAGKAVEIAIAGNVIYMEASAAIARGAAVMGVVSGAKVASATVGKTTIGFALDKAAGNAALIRVYMETPNSIGGDSFVPAANVAALAGTLTGTVAGTIVDVPAAVAASGEATAADLTTTNLAIVAVNLALKELQTKVNAEIAALKTAGLQATS